MPKGGWVYIMANRYRGTIYLGVTSSIPHRAMQNRDRTGSAFTAKYGCALLVFAEHYEDIHEAMVREKQLKEWNRVWKIRLIEEQNPDWEDRFETLV